MAQVDFFLSENANALQINHSSGGSGLGFYGVGFGQAIPVASYQDTTFITNGAGTVQGAQTDNNKFINSSSVSINGGGTILLTQLPNYLTTCEVRFTHSSAVQCQNWTLRAYDRSNIDNAPSGVTLKVASVSHLSTLQSDNNGSGNSTWVTPAGSSVIHTLLPPSPGLSGQAQNGVGTTGSWHSWYTALSASPTSTGSKTQFGLYVAGEYL
jgi:hypothetical protein